MSVHVVNGIGYSEKSGARFFDMSALSSVEEKINNPLQSTIPADKIGAQPWSPWGANNLLPMEMAADIETCGILNSIIDGKSRFAINNGIVPVIQERNSETGVIEIKEYVNDPEILDFLDMNNSFYQVYGWMKDQIGFAQGVARFGLNRKKDPKIVKFLRHDVVEFRYQKKNAKGIITDVWFAAEWNRVTGKDDNKVFTNPLLDETNPVADLIDKVKRGAGNQYAMTFRYPGWNKHYYSVPLWYAAYKWVKIAQGVPEMKAAIFENSIHVKYVVIIYQDYWNKAFPEWKKYTPDQKKTKRQDVYDDIDKFLVGSKNAYKSIFTNGYRDKDGKVYAEIEIKPVEDNQKDGKLLPDSAAANSEIAFAMHFNNAIIGGNQASGLYEQSQGGSNVRESVMLQVMLHELERQNVRRVMMVIAYFNGWKKKYPGLDFIIPATLLTTLDTGSSTKTAVTGPAKVKPDNTN